MTQLIEKLKQLLFTKKQHLNKPNMNESSFQSSASSGQSETAVLTDDVVKMLMHEIAQTREGMLSCSDSFALLDEYVEYIITNAEDAAHVMPLVKAHIDACPDCKECAEMLLKMFEIEE